MEMTTVDRFGASSSDHISPYAQMCHSISCKSVGVIPETKCFSIIFTMNCIILDQIIFQHTNITYAIHDSMQVIYLTIIISLK